MPCFFTDLISKTHFTEQLCKWVSQKIFIKTQIFLNITYHFCLWIQIAFCCNRSGIKWTWNFCAAPLDLIQQSQAFPELDTVLKIGSHESRAEGPIFVPWPSGNASFMQHWMLLAFCPADTHFQLIHQDPKVLFLLVCPWTSRHWQTDTLAMAKRFRQSLIHLIVCPWNLSLQFSVQDIVRNCTKGLAEVQVDDINSSSLDCWLSHPILPYKAAGVLRYGLPFVKPCWLCIFTSLLFMLFGIFYLPGKSLLQHCQALRWGWLVGSSYGPSF